MQQVADWLEKLGLGNTQRFAEKDGRFLRGCVMQRAASSVVRCEYFTRILPNSVH
jgi:hypothetical protein